MAGFWNMFQSPAPAASAPPTGQANFSGAGPGPANPSSQNVNGQQQNEPGNRPSNGATIPGQNNGNFSGNNQNTSQQTAPNPLDIYSKTFENRTTSEDAPPSFTLDPKQMDSIVGSLDFTRGIDPAVMQKATQGDANALLEIIQSVGRNSYRAAIEHGGVLTDKFVGAREAHSNKGFPNRVRSELVTNQLASNTPNFQHPVVRQQLTEIAQRFQAQHPDATAKEIGDMSIKYLQDLMDAIRPPESNQQQSSQQKNEVRGEEFWNNYFSEGDDQS